MILFIDWGQNSVCVSSVNGLETLDPKWNSSSFSELESYLFDFQHLTTSNHIIEDKSLYHPKKNSSSTKLMNQEGYHLLNVHKVLCWPKPNSIHITKRKSSSSSLLIDALEEEEEDDFKVTFKCSNNDSSSSVYKKSLQFTQKYYEGVKQRHYMEHSEAVLRQAINFMDPPIIHPKKEPLMNKLKLQKSKLSIYKKGENITEEDDFYKMVIEGKIEVLVFGEKDTMISSSKFLYDRKQEYAFLNSNDEMIFDHEKYNHFPREWWEQIIRMEEKNTSIRN